MFKPNYTLWALHCPIFKKEIFLEKVPKVTWFGRRGPYSCESWARLIYNWFEFRVFSRPVAIPKLKKLRLPYHLITTEGVKHTHTRCCKRWGGWFFSQRSFRRMILKTGAVRAKALLSLTQTTIPSLLHSKKTRSERGLFVWSFAAFTTFQ